ncbi:MAG TPA: hypothetical protein V6C65_15020 [Allocoleopsis sp.]
MTAIYRTPQGCFHATSFPDPDDTFITVVQPGQNVWELLQMYETFYNSETEEDSDLELDESDFRFDF